MPERRIAASRIEVRLSGSVPDRRRVASELPSAIAQQLASSIRAGRGSAWIPRLALTVKLPKDGGVAAAVATAIASAIGSSAGAADGSPGGRARRGVS